MTNAHPHPARLTWLLAVLLAALRVAWIWPWLLTLGAWMAPSYGQPLLPLWTLFALLLGGRAAAQLATARTHSLQQARAWMAVLGPLLLLLLIWWHYGRPLALWDVRWLQNATGTPDLWAREMAPAVLAFFAAAGLWLRGVLDGGKVTDHEAIVGAFVTGSIAFALLLVSTRLAGVTPVAGSQAWLVVLVTAGMAALALASLERALYAGGGGAPSRLPLNRYWLGAVAVVITAVLLLGFLLSALIAPETVAQALGLFAPIIDLLAQVLLAILYAVVYVMFLVLSPLIAWLRRLIASLQLTDPMADAAEFQPLSPLLMDQTSGPPAELVEPFRWGVIVAVLVAAAVIFALSLRLLKLVESAEEEETRTSILSRALLNEQLRALWARLRGQAGAHAAADFLTLTGESSARREVRARYQAFLAAMAARHRPRPPGATPATFAGELAELTAAQKSALHTLTDRYVAVRYGDGEPAPLPPSVADIEWRSDAGAP